jgi:hypothetical protein
MSEIFLMATVCAILYYLLVMGWIHRKDKW